jgi:hypothetical protein
MDESDLWLWRCSCGATSHKKPTTLERARENMRKHAWRAMGRALAKGRAPRPHMTTLLVLPKMRHFTGRAPVFAECPVCRKKWRVTDRGTLWRHRPNRELAAYCPGGGPRAPHPPPKKRDLDAPQPRRTQAFADLVQQLQAQDIRRDPKVLPRPRRGPR